MEKIRRYDIDWLRVIAFYLLIVYHVGMFFVPWDWHVKNSLTYEWLETWMAWLGQFRLPLLFVISGIGVYYALGFRTGLEFVKERSKRLLIPLVFGILFIVPPQIYFERLTQGQEYLNYWRFWLTIFDFKLYPNGGSLSWHHLWFLPYIFVYSILSLPIFLFLRSHKSERLKKSLSKYFDKSYRRYQLGIPFLIIFVFLAREFPTTHDLINDWYNFTYSFAFFIMGFFLASIPNLWSKLEELKNISLAVSLIPMSILVLFVYGPTFEIFNEDSAYFFYIYAILKIGFVVPWLFAIFGYSRILLNRPSKILIYANQSVYPFYILHQSIIVSVGYFIIDSEINDILKYFILLFSAFIGSFLMYETIIKKFRITRILFGLKNG